MTSGLRPVAILLAVASTGVAVDARAQSGTMRIAIGAFTSEQQCTTYALTSGSERASASSASGGYIGPFGAGGASSASMSYERQWRTELVRDCVNNFVAVRKSLEAAIAASGHAVVVPAGRGGYVVTGRISEAGAMSSSLRGGGVAKDAVDAAINIEFSLRDPGGRVISGNLITKRLNVASTVNNGVANYSTRTEGRSVYTQLQREAALAVGRAVAFKLDPLRVVAVADGRVQVNYGAPLLPVGGTVFLEARAGRQIKTNVANSSGSSAWLETYGGGDLGAVPIGSEANFVEADDPAGNTPLRERVDLP